MQGTNAFLPFTPLLLSSGFQVRYLKIVQYYGPVLVVVRVLRHLEDCAFTWRSNLSSDIANDDVAIVQHKASYDVAVRGWKLLWRCASQSLETAYRCDRGMADKVGKSSWRHASREMTDAQSSRKALEVTCPCSQFQRGQPGKSAAGQAAVWREGTWPQGKKPRFGEKCGVQAGCCGRSLSQMVGEWAAAGGAREVKEQLRHAAIRCARLRQTVELAINTPSALPLC